MAPPRVGVDLLAISRFAPIARHRFCRAVFTEGELAAAEGLGAEGLAAEGLGAEGLGAEGLGAEGLGAEGLGDGRRVEWLAGRFCAKEAVCKVLGRGFGQGLGWRDIEISADRWGAPRVVLRGGARLVAGRAGLREVTLTLTHQADLVVAVAMAVPAAPRPRRPRRAGRRPVH